MKQEEKAQAHTSTAHPLPLPPLHTPSVCVFGVLITAFFTIAQAVCDLFFGFLCLSVRALCLSVSLSRTHTHASTRTRSFGLRSVWPAWLVSVPYRATASLVLSAVRFANFVFHLPNSRCPLLCCGSANKHVARRSRHHHRRHHYLTHTRARG